MKFLKGVERSLKHLVPQSWRKYLRASKYELVMSRVRPVDLIVHVGAHWAEDAALYESYGARTVLWVEADPDTFAKLQHVLARRDGATDHRAECALVSASAGEELTFHRFSGDGSSSSIHSATDTFKARFPHVQESGEILEMVTRTLPDILARHGIHPDDYQKPMLVVDVQGHELEVLKGIGAGLGAFQLCKCEVSRVPMYEGGAMFPDIDAVMRDAGFRLVSHSYARVPRHGDVLYAKP